jgi:hypothetical protein
MSHAHETVIKGKRYGIPGFGETGMRSRTDAIRTISVANMTRNLFKNHLFGGVRVSSLRLFAAKQLDKS